MISDMTVLRKKILLVDEEQIILNSIGLCLSFMGFDVIVAQSTEQGLFALQGEPFDVVICDHRLPEFDGLDFLKMSMQIQPNAVRIAMVNYLGCTNLSSAYRMGIHEILAKPFSLINLKKAIDTYTVYYQGRMVLEGCENQWIH